jgi:predicted PurR-regulated permease PerM
VAIERERAVLEEGPLPRGRPERSNRGCTIAGMSAPAGLPPRIRIPRWVQLVGLPLLLVLTWTVAIAAGHVVFLFLVAGVIALLLDPLVRTLERFRVPRGVSVALVYLSFAAILVVAVLALATVVVDQTKTAANRFNDYFTDTNGRTHEPGADRDVDRLQRWLDTHHLKSLQVQKKGHEVVKRVRERDVGKYTSRVVDFAEGTAVSVGKGLFATILLLVISIYMLLDMPRFGRFLDRRFPPYDGGSLLLRVEHALASYVRGQLLLSLIIGTSAGVGIYLLGFLGWMPNGEKYALLFGAWVAVTEVVPYVGPWLGAIPPFVYALVAHPVSAIWVAILFLVIHQIEGHIVVPNVMGSALRLHPLLVIFGLLVGTEVYGLPGALISLPLLATARALWEFFGDRVTLEPWADAAVPVEIEVVEPPQTKPTAVER